MTLIKDLGLLAGMVRRNTAPSNTQILWYDLTSNTPKYYNAGTLAWESLSGSASALSTVLATGNTTGGTDIHITLGDKIRYLRGAYNGDLVAITPLSANRTWTLPNASGTIALLSDIPSVPSPQNLNSVLTVGNTTGAFNILFQNNNYGIEWSTTGGDVISVRKVGAGASEYLSINSDGGAGISLRHTDVLGTNDAVVIDLRADSNKIILSSETPANNQLMLEFRVEGDVIGDIRATDTTMMIRSLKANEAIEFHANSIKIAEADGQGVGLFRINTQIVFDETYTDVIPGSVLDPAGKSSVIYNRVGAPSSFNIDGISGGAVGNILILHNDSDDTLVLRHKATLFSTRIINASGANVNVQKEQSALLHYSSVLGAWITISPRA